MRLISSLAIAALLAVTGGVVATPASADGTEPDPVFGAPVFNDPAGTEAAQYAIFQQLARVIDRVPAGETIQMSWFEFKVGRWTDTAAKPDLTTRLIRAHQRGVNVRIILDNTTSTYDGKTQTWVAKTDRNAVRPPYLDLKAELGTSTTASSFIMLCRDNSGCIGKRKIGNTNAYNHNKFLTASRVVLDDGTAKSDVVFQSSGNLGTWDADTAYNNAMTWSEHASYTNYLTYFADLKTYGAASSGNNNYYRVGNTLDAYKTHFFPRMETDGRLDQAATDTIVSVLDSVKCKYVGTADGLTHQTDIRIVMWSLTRTAVADKLAALVKAGCWVDIVYSMIDGDALAVLKALNPDPAKPKVGLTPCAASFGGRKIKTHSKYLLIDGAYDDDQDPRVFMGSHNYSVTALRSADEAMVRIRDAAVHSAYQHDNFYPVRDFCKAKTTPEDAKGTVLNAAAAAAAVD